jgi:hypothetical protein
LGKILMELRQELRESKKLTWELALPIHLKKPVKLNQKLRRLKSNRSGLTKQAKNKSANKSAE